MPKFFMQHVGEALSKRDFPKSLGTPPDEFVNFTFGVLKEMLPGPLGLNGSTQATLEALEPFQIWGLPQGAEPYTKQMNCGDHLMLQGSERTCEYIGEILCTLPHPSPEISAQIWGERKFPWIVLLHKSQFINVLWSDFLNKVHYSPNYRLQGATSRVSDKKLTAASLSSDDLSMWLRKS